MEENKQDGQWTHVLDQEQVDMEEAVVVTQFSPVAELVAYDFMRHEPTDEDAGQEAYYGQENLTRDEVEPVEQRLTEERQPIDSP